jgi:large subunit ribosomal protein L16
MLIPRRVKHRKQHHPNRRGAAKGGTALAFGDFGIQALEGHYVTNRQIEAARIAMTRHIKRGGKVWINIYPDRPLTKKPAETRMGSPTLSPAVSCSSSPESTRRLLVRPCVVRFTSFR